MSNRIYGIILIIAALCFGVAGVMRYKDGSMLQFGLLISVSLFEIIAGLVYIGKKPENKDK